VYGEVKGSDQRCSARSMEAALLSVSFGVASGCNVIKGSGSPKSRPDASASFAAG
jgi:hypothetical protein